MQKSPFLREYHRGLAGAPLTAIPPLSKSTLMEFWDDLVTTPGLRREEVLHHLASQEAEGSEPARPWRGRWWMAATGGTTGERGVFVWNRREWVAVLASYARVNDWAGVSVGLRHPLPTAIVSTRNPTHQSAVVGASLSSSLVPTLRLDATEPMDTVVERLNRFQPRLLVAYASMIPPLAEAQLSGALRIAPEKVISASEELLPAACEIATRAWTVETLNTYAATETATIASMCPLGSLHLYEDFVIAEPVDDSYQPVPEGQDDRLLVTVLFSRTLPLLRYELDDRIRLATTPCACGSPYRVVELIRGRTDASLRLATEHGGTVVVYPSTFYDAIGPVAVRGWQVRQTPSGLTVRVVDPDRRLDPSAIVQALRTSLMKSGVAPQVSVGVERAPALDRTHAGKLPLIVPERLAGAVSRPA
jgi:putative adenylate-forming enzyme